MGIIVAKFKRKKTTYDILEKLENEIKAIEEFGRNTEQTQKKMVCRFIFVSVFGYFVSAVIFYFYFFPAKLTDRIIYIVPLILLPLLIWFIKKILTWYYSRKLSKNQKKLISLKEQKKKILDEVMDKETYKVAKTILEKFAPEQIKRPDPVVALAGTTPFGTPSVGPFQQQTQTPGLRYRPSRQVPNRPQSIRTLSSTATPSLLPSAQVTPLMQSVQRPAPLPLTLPRSILPKERSFIDKMVDYLVGDGPSNRYALICKNCAGHNGMALKEEFDYLSFRCCYCSAFNPARKQRPSAPALEFGSLQDVETQPNSSEDEGAENEENNIDSEEKSPEGSRSDSPPLITELIDDEQKANENKTNIEPMETDASDKTDETTEA